MRFKLTLAVLAALALLAVSGCPRNPGGEDATPPPAPVTNNTKTDINITTPPAETPETAPPADGSTPPAVGTAPPVDGTAAPPADGTTPPADGTATPPAEGDAGKTDGSTVAGGDAVVVLETTKGVIEITIHKDWAPLGSVHFLKVVNAKFYDGAPWFRVLDGFVAQAGVAADPAMNAKWSADTIQDEPVVKGNVKGTVCFGKGGPNSRSTHFFINYADNTSMLDPQGFACFGEVTKGMDVALKLFRISDQAFGMAGLNQGSLSAEGGLAAFKKAFPEADYILKAYVK